MKEGWNRAGLVDWFFAGGKVCHRKQLLKSGDDRRSVAAGRGGGGEVVTSAVG